jgi:translation elongation factor EF-1alpha
LVVVPISAWTGENVVTAPSSLSWYKGPMLFEVMEQSASAVTKPAPGEVAAVKRPVFGPARISVLRRANKRCTGATDTQKQEEVVEALVQSGMVREGQVLEAIVVAPITTARRHSRRGHILPKPTTLATFTVVSIQRFDKPRYACACTCFTTSVLPCSSS